ncbi:helix-turn-helix domain-containing protein [Shewanella sp. A14]
MRALATWQDKCIDSHLLVASLLSLFKQRDLDCHKLLRGTSIFIADIRKPETKISPKQLNQLIDNALQIWPHGDLSFLLGQQWLPAQSGVLTAGVFCAKNLNELAQFWYRYHWLTHPWLQCWHKQGSSQWHFLLSFDLGCHQHIQFFIELSLSSWVACCKQLMGESWQGSVSFPYATPDNLAQYYKYFGTDVSFDAPLCRVSMQKHFMDKSLLFNPVGHGGLINQPRHILRNCSPRLGLASAIRMRLMHHSANLPEMATALEMSPATLKRRLGEMGLTFGQLVDETRLIKALYCLATSQDNNQSLAASLAFSDPSNFRRSFKRWTGQLPSYFRCWLA